MPLMHRIVATGSVAALALGGLIATSPMAHADSCSSLAGTICVWSDTNYAGSEHNIDGNIGDCQGIPFAAKSVKNFSTRAIVFYSTTNCTGLPVQLVLGNSNNPNLPPSRSALVG
jgi:hypothetical protein